MSALCSRWGAVSSDRDHLRLGLAPLLLGAGGLAAQSSAGLVLQPDRVAVEDAAGFGGLTPAWQRVEEHVDWLPPPDRLSGRGARWILAGFPLTPRVLSGSGASAAEPSAVDAPRHTSPL